MGPIYMPSDPRGIPIAIRLALLVADRRSLVAGSLLVLRLGEDDPDNLTDT